MERDLQNRKTQKIYSCAFNPLTDHMYEDTLIVLVFVLSKVQTLKHKVFEYLISRPLQHVSETSDSLISSIFPLTKQANLFRFSNSHS